MEYNYPKFTPEMKQTHTILIPNMAITQFRLPEFVTREEFDWAVQEATAKKKRDFSTAEFRTYDEGLCVQCMHIGPYDTEPETLRQMDAFAAEQGYVPDYMAGRLHHEIYLSGSYSAISESLICARKIMSS